MVSCLLVNHSWEDYKKTTQFVGFATEKERSLLFKGIKLVYFGNGLVAGIFEAAGFAENEFRGWPEERPFQVKLMPVHIPEQDLIAKPLRYKVQLEQPVKGATCIYLLSEQEYKKIELAIISKKKELIY